MAKHETIMSVDKTTKEVMNYINKEVCEAIAGSLEQNLKTSFRPVKNEIEQITEKIQADLKAPFRKMEETLRAQSSDFSVRWKEMLALQEKTLKIILVVREKTAAELKEGMEKVAGIVGTFETILSNQTAILERLKKIEEDTAYLKQPMLKRLFKKGETKNEKP